MPVNAPLNYILSFFCWPCVQCQESRVIKQKWLANNQQPLFSGAAVIPMQPVVTTIVVNNPAVQQSVATQQPSFHVATANAAMNGQWTVLATATVRNGLSTKSKEVRRLKTGTIVQVFAQGEFAGHQRVR